MHLAHSNYCVLVTLILIVNTSNSSKQISYFIRCHIQVLQELWVCTGNSDPDRVFHAGFSTTVLTGNVVWRLCHVKLGLHGGLHDVPSCTYKINEFADALISHTVYCVVA